jgi:hypothetical protein
MPFITPARVLGDGIDSTLEGLDRAIARRRKLPPPKDLWRASFRTQREQYIVLSIQFFRWTFALLLICGGAWLVTLAAIP